MTLNTAYSHYVDAGATPDAMDELLAAVRRYALKTARRRRMNDPESLAQDITFRAYQMHEKYNPERGNYQAWIAVLTRNYLLTAHHSIKRQSENEVQDDPINIDQSPAQETENENNRDVSNMPTNIQKIVAYLTMGYTKVETATRLGMSMGRLEKIINNYLQTA